MSKTSNTSSKILRREALKRKHPPEVPPAARSSGSAHKLPGPLSSHKGSIKKQIKFLDLEAGEPVWRGGLIHTNSSHRNPHSNTSAISTRQRPVEPLYYCGHNCAAKTEKELLADFHTRLCKAKSLSLTEPKPFPLRSWRSQSYKVIRRLYTDAKEEMPSTGEMELDEDFRKRLDYLLMNVYQGLWRPSPLICELIEDVANERQGIRVKYLKEFENVLNLDIKSSKAEDPRLQKALKLPDDLYCLNWLVWSDELKAQSMTFKQLPGRPSREEGSVFTVTRQKMQSAVNEICFKVEPLDRYLSEAFAGRMENRRRQRTSRSPWPQRLLSSKRPSTSSSSALQTVRMVSAAIRADQDKELLLKFPALTDTTEKSHILVRKLFCLPGSRNDQFTVEDCEEAAARARRLLLEASVTKGAWKPSPSTRAFLKGLSSTEVSKPKVIEAYCTALSTALTVARESSHGDDATVEAFLTLLDDLVCIKMTVADETKEMVTVKFPSKIMPCTMGRKDLQSTLNSVLFHCHGSQELIEYMKVALRYHKDYDRLMNALRDRKRNKSVPRKIRT